MNDDFPAEPLGRAFAALRSALLFGVALALTPACGDQTIDAVVDDDDSSGAAGAAGNPDGAGASGGEDGPAPDLTEAVSGELAWAPPSGEPGAENFDGLWAAGSPAREDNLQDHPALAPDGKGGVFVVWHVNQPDLPTNFLNDHHAHVFAQHIDADGKKLWGADGVAVVDTEDDQRFAKVVADAEGGIYVAWQDRRSTPAEVRVQHLDAAGERSYAEEGLKLSGGGKAKLLPAPEGDAFVVHRKSDRILVDRLDPSGKVGDTEKSEGFAAVDSFIAKADDDGVIAAWSPGDRALYVQRLVHGGTSSSAAKVVELETSASTFDATPDGKGGAFVVWSRSSDDFFGFEPGRAQHVTADGKLDWKAEGLLLTPVDDLINQSSFVVATDGAGGMLALWVDGRFGSDSNIYGQRVDSAGDLLWESEGRPIVDSLGAQDRLRGVPDGHGGVFVLWTDQRSINFDLFLGRFGKDGQALLEPRELRVTSSARQQLVGQLAKGPRNVFAAWVNKPNRAGDTTGTIELQRVTLK